MVLLLFDATLMCELFFYFNRIRWRFYEMCSPSLLLGLKETIQSLSEKWSELAYLLTEKITVADDCPKFAETVENLASNPFQVRRFYLNLFLQSRP